jgi:hypothetical protein
MANSDKDILITPNVGQTSEPLIKWNGANNTPLYTRVLDDGTVSFEGTAGQLFSISDGLSGTIFSVNDISGIPSIEVLDTGEVRLAQYGGNVGIGKSSPTTALDVNGTATATSFASTVATGTAPLTVTSTTVVTNLNADLVDGLQVHTGTNNEANKIVRTDGNGYIQAGWINTASGDNGTTAISRIYASQDGYIRYYSPANFISVLGITPTITAKDDITTRTTSGFFESSTATTAEGWPETTNSWYHLISSTHSNVANYYALQLAAPFYNNKLYFRSTNGSGTTGWSQIATVDQLGSGGLDPFFLSGM